MTTILASVIIVAYTLFKFFTSPTRWNQIANLALFFGISALVYHYVWGLRFPSGLGQFVDIVLGNSTTGYPWNWVIFIFFIGGLIPIGVVTFSRAYLRTVDDENNNKPMGPTD
jgi:RsiW-degrading membrane proteinase PrsW (M82 family)